MKTEPSYYHFSRPEVVSLVDEDALTILDVGCAAGGIGKALLARNPERKLYGIEQVAEVAEEAAKVYHQVLSCSVEEELPFEEQFFDAIICADVLEHLSDPWKTVKRLRRHLKPKGKLIASIPNIAHWSILTQLMQGNWYYENAGILDRTHLRFFTKNSILSLFRDAGYHISHLGGTSTGSNPTDIPAFRNGLEALGIPADMTINQGMVFQYLSVAERFDPPGKVSLFVGTATDAETTKECIQRIRNGTEKGSYELYLVDRGTHPLTDEDFNALPIVDAGQEMSAGELLPELSKLHENPFFCYLDGNSLPSPRLLERLRYTLSWYDNACICAPVSNSAEPIQYEQEAAQLSRKEADNYAERRFYNLNSSSREVKTLDTFCLFGFTAFMRQLKPQKEFHLLGEALQAQGFRLVVCDDVFLYRTVTRKQQEETISSQAFTIPLEEAETELFGGPVLRVVCDDSLKKEEISALLSSLKETLPAGAEISLLNQQEAASPSVNPDTPLPFVLYVGKAVCFTKNWFEQFAELFRTCPQFKLCGIRPRDGERCPSEDHFEIQRYARRVWRTYRNDPPVKVAGTGSAAVVLFTLEGWQNLLARFPRGEWADKTDCVIAPNTYLHTIP